MYPSFASGNMHFELDLKFSAALFSAFVAYPTITIIIYKNYSDNFDHLLNRAIHHSKHEAGDESEQAAKDELERAARYELEQARLTRLSIYEEDEKIGKNEKLTEAEKQELRNKLEERNQLNNINEMIATIKSVELDPSKKMLIREQLYQQAKKLDYITMVNIYNNLIEYIRLEKIDIEIHDTIRTICRIYKIISNYKTK